MHRHPKKMFPILATLLPFITCGAQWLFWDYLKPFVWFLFYPTVYFSSRLGGKRAGVVATIVSALLVVYFFIPPQLSFSGKPPNNLFSVVVFLIMGLLFSYTHDLLERSERREIEAWEAARSASEQLQEARIESLEAQQRLAEEQLLQSEEKFSRAFACNPAAIAVTRLDDGLFVDVNETWVMLMGYSREEAIGQSARSMQIWPTAEAAQRFVHELQEKGTVRGWEQEFLKKSGERFVAQLSSQLLVMRGEQHILSTLVDVTTQKQAEAALRESEARLRTILNNAADAVFVATPDGRLIFVNEEATRILGMSRAELLTMGLVDIVPPHQVGQSMAGFQRLKENGRLFMETNLSHRDGHVIPVELNAVALPDGTFYGACRDISPRRKAEDTLRKLFAAVEQSPAIVVITDRQGNIEFVNPRFCHVTGYSMEEVLGRKPALLRGDNSDELFRELWATIEAGMVWEGDFHNRRKDGTMYWEHAVISPIRDENGETTHYLAVKEDITERRSLEEQLHQSQKMEAVGQLAGGVAHDFNNIMQVIMGNAQLQSMYNKEHGIDSRYLDEIFKAVERGSSLTKSLLVFSRKQPLELSRFDLSGLTSESQKLVQRLVTEDIVITVDLPVTELWVHGDAGLVQQMLFNLVNNARDAIGGHGHIGIRVAAIQIDDAFREARGISAPAGCYAQLTVCDDGCGIDDETQKRIFEPFFTTKEAGKGTGLGLAMIYGTVNRMNGFITYASTPGHGSEFAIHLPCAGVSEQPEHGVAHAAGYLHGNG